MRKWAIAFVLLILAAASARADEIPEYGDYLLAHGAPYYPQTALRAVLADTDGAQCVALGRECVLLENGRRADYAVTAAQAGYYTLSLSILSAEAPNSAYEIDLLVNGETPFKEAAGIIGKETVDKRERRSAIRRLRQPTVAPSKRSGGMARGIPQKRRGLL